MVDRDATDVTDTATNQNVETAMVEAATGCKATVMTAILCQQKNHGQKAMSIDITNRIDATTATDMRETIAVTKSRHTTLTTAT